MIRRRARVALALHIAYAGGWLLLSPHGHDVVERWVILAAMATAGVFYAGMAVAFVWARKTRLNVAFAIQKFYWALLIWLLVIPSQGGIAFGHAPYTRYVNPYAWWVLPGWGRTYVWLGVTAATVGVSYEFFRANDLWPFGRRGGEDTVVSERTAPPPDVPALPIGWPDTSR